MSHSFELEAMTAGPFFITHQERAQSATLAEAD